MIGLLELVVGVTLLLGTVWVGNAAVFAVKEWLHLRRKERADARQSFESAVRLRKRVHVTETLAIHGPRLTKHEKAVLNELRDDFVIEEEEKRDAVDQKP